jgi:shikimate dehydrogenase
LNYGLIGEKLGHSFSVPIHNAFGNPDYVLKEIPRDELVQFLEAGDFKGLNVTIPYKQDVMPFCTLDEAAAQIGAVNTLVVKDGKIFGYNTDAYGLSSMMDLAYGVEDVDFTGKNAVILGAGGTAKTALYVLRSKHVASVTVLARDVQKAKESLNSDGVTFESITEPSADVCNRTDIIVNTTPVGMFPKADAVPVDLSLFPHVSAVFDVIYNPLTTKLIAKAKQRNLVAANGLYMLVMQAYKAELLFGLTPAQAGQKVYEDLRKRLENTVLIGMPGSGKSTIGKLLSEKCGKEFIDTDEEFTKTYGITPGDCIKTEGEEAFRLKETEVVKTVSAKTGCIIATGGGVVTRPENIEALKQNGIIVYLKRDIANLSSEGRPLSQGDGAIEKLFEKRSPLYEAAADRVIEVKEGLLEETLAEITG